MRVRSAVRPIAVAVVCSMLVVIPAAASRAGISCSTTVPAGGDIQAALSAQPERAVICVSSGTYTLAAQLVPKARQTIAGLSSRLLPTIACQAILFCIDGSLGPEHVTLKHLIFDGAKNVDVRTGNSWTLNDVEARNAVTVGIVVNGSGVVVSGSYAHDNGQFGLRAVNATKLKVTNTEVAFNATAPGSDPRFTGGLKINGVVGLVLKKNDVHDNGGGGGIWLDIDSQNFQVIANTSTNNALEEIRVEISCYGTMQSNTVAGGSIAGIDVFNAHDVAITTNSVSAPAGALNGIRMLSNGRTSSPGTQSCLTAGTYENTSNAATSNTVALTDATTLDGVDDNGGISAGNSWSGDVYSVPDCNGPQWQWWDGTLGQTVNFAGWQALGQDATGSCVSALTESPPTP
jgi:hypothetical protein